MADQRAGRRNAGPADEPATAAGNRGGAPVCPVAFCPVGLALTFAEVARPDVVEHLMAAGRELLLAVKAIVDARAEAAQEDGGLERITIT